MFDLDRAVLSWRREFVRQRSFSTDDLDELEDHLRALYALELELGPALTPARAFAHACESLGRPDAMSEEFAKVGGRWWRRLLRLGRLAFGVSFLLPVARGGITLARMDLHDGGLPGIQAFLLAVQSDPLSAASALTNAAMLLSFWRIRDAGRGWSRRLAIALSACAALNLTWLLRMAPVSDLLPGYYLWLVSFAVTSAAFGLRARSLPADAARERPVTS